LNKTDFPSITGNAPSGPIFPRPRTLVPSQLKMLNTISAQKEKALSVLAELQNKGVSSDAIYGFSKILDLERMGREWNPLGPRE
jgi:hypothetical protein